ncbi:MAG: lipopolysaccharide biosynthesis protein [Roseibium aggregatum]
MARLINLSAEDSQTAGRLMRNFSWVFSSQAVSGVISIGTLAIMAQSLGPAGLGLFAIFQAYVRIVDRLLRLEPWQAVIKYGVDALSDDDGDRFMRLLKGSVYVNLAGSTLAAGVSILAAQVTVRMMGWPEDSAAYLALFSLALLLNLKPTAVAVLRIFDRFDVLAKVDVGIALLRLVLSAGVWLMGYGLWGFVLVAVIEGLANSLLPFVYSLRYVHQRGYGKFMQLPIRGIREENPGILRFLWNSNFNVIIRQTVQRLDVILLSVLVDEKFVGFFHIARRVADSALKLGRPLNQAIFPELARKWSSGEERGFYKLVNGVLLAIAGLCVVVLVPAAFLMPYVLSVMFGAGFNEAANMVNVQLLAVILLLATMVLNPAMLSMGRDRELLWVTLLGSVMFLACFAPLVGMLGPVGASVAHVLFNGTLVAGTLFVLYWSRRQPTVRRPA